MKKVHQRDTINKLISILSEYQTPQRVNVQGQLPHRMAAAPTETVMPVLYKEMHMTS
jgi:hypothetical protein